MTAMKAVRASSSPLARERHGGAVTEKLGSARVTWTVDTSSSGGDAGASSSDGGLSATSSVTYDLKQNKVD